MPGPDGRNLLGFLTAIGALRVLAHEAPDLALSWGTDHRPVIHRPEADGVWDEERLLNDLEAGLEASAAVDRFPWDNLAVKPEKFREYAIRALQTASPRNRHWIDFVAGLASDAAPTDSNGNVADTAFRTMSGAGHQNFLRFMKDLQGRVERRHLQEALFTKWTYRDRKLSLRWDPLDDRRYALRADDPSKGSHNDIPSMWGANRLAFEALACFPTYPTSRGLETSGFVTPTRRRSVFVFHWPLWKPPVTLDGLRALLGHAAIASRDARQLRDLGVYAVLSSRRFTEGRYRNFAPAEIWPVP
ncbi:MAG: hypothetical protein Kow00109_26670 [Acidobacteriota bacterium]